MSLHNAQSVSCIFFFVSVGPASTTYFIPKMAPHLQHPTHVISSLNRIVLYQFVGICVVLVAFKPCLRVQDLLLAASHAVCHQPCFWPLVKLLPCSLSSDQHHLTHSAAAHTLLTASHCDACRTMSIYAMWPILQPTEYMLWQSTCLV